MLPAELTTETFEPPDDAPEALAKAYWAGRCFISPDDAADEWEKACELFAVAFPEAPGNAGPTLFDSSLQYCERTIAFLCEAKPCGWLAAIQCMARAGEAILQAMKNVNI